MDEANVVLPDPKHPAISSNVPSDKALPSSESNSATPVVKLLIKPPS